MRKRFGEGGSRMKKLLQAVSMGFLLFMGIASSSPSASPDLASPLTHNISALLPSLEVLSDSCHVFDEPRTNPHYFGPLREGEKVKWLDSEGDWTHVWIPRLRISGWVKSRHVYATEQVDPTPITIPSILFTKVVVKEKTANIRSEAKAEAAVLIIAKRDQEFVLVNARRGWFQVWSTDLNKPGWIFAKSVTRQVRK